MTSKTQAPKASAKPKWAAKLADTKGGEPDKDYSAIAEDLTAWLEDAYKHWQADNLDWRITGFDTPEDAMEAEEAAKWWCRNREGGPLTFTRKKYEDPLVLIFRVRDKITRPRKPAEIKHDTGASDNSSGSEQESPATPDDVLT